MLESFDDALVECVKACGGSKAVGVALWPSKGIEAAQRHLLSCLNPDRNEKLGPDEVLHVLRLARDKGCHIGMQYLAASLCYAEPVPTDPKDELTELLRRANELNEQVLRSNAQIARLMTGQGMRGGA